MKTKKQIEDKLTELTKDDILNLPNATIDINAPLALIQLNLQSKIEILNWVLQEES